MAYRVTTAPAAKSRSAPIASSLVDPVTGSRPLTIAVGVELVVDTPGQV